MQQQAMVYHIRLGEDVGKEVGEGVPTQYPLYFLMCLKQYISFYFLLLNLNNLFVP